MEHLTIRDLVVAALFFLGALFGVRFRPPSDLERADLLERIARGAVAEILRVNPNLGAESVVAEVVRVVSAAPGVPTRNLRAIQRAAAVALKALRPDDHSA